MNTEDSNGKATEEFYGMDLKQKTAKGTEKEREHPLKKYFSNEGNEIPAMLIM